MSERESVEIVQLFLFREIYNEPLEGALWAGLKQVELLFDLDHVRFTSLMLSATRSDPRSVLYQYEEDMSRFSSQFDVDPRSVQSVIASPQWWDDRRGKYTQTLQQETLGAEMRKLLKLDSTVFLNIVTDAEITPPRNWRYILWETYRQQREGVASIAPMDPVYWGAPEDRKRIGVMKHRVRSTCCAIAGKFLDMQRCENERCFLLEPIDSVTQLDEMRFIGPEHHKPELAGLGFDRTDDSWRPAPPRRSMLGLSLESNQGGFGDE